MADLFTIRDCAQAARKLATLERQADRRDTFVDALDFAALDRLSQARIERADFEARETILFGHLYLIHLAQMEELGATLTHQQPKAA